jgi:hypothetical protein
MHDFRVMLRRIEKYEPALNWIASQPDWQTAWEQCPNGNWMIWVCAKLGAHKRYEIPLAIACLQYALKHATLTENRVLLEESIQLLQNPKLSSPWDLSEIEHKLHYRTRGSLSFPDLTLAQAAMRLTKDRLRCGDSYSEHTVEALCDTFGALTDLISGDRVECGTEIAKIVRSVMPTAPDLGIVQRFM